MRVLVAENDPDVLNLLCDVLGDFHIKATGVVDPREAARLVSTTHWDVVLSDLLFPGSFTGIDVAAQAAARGIHCVIMSGAVDQGPAIEARGIPFLAKPFSIPELLAAIGDDIPGELAA